MLYFHGATHGLRALSRVGFHTNLYESSSGVHLFSKCELHTCDRLVTVQLFLYKIEFLGQVGSVTSRKMTSIAHSKNINKFITAFLSEHGSEDLAEMWNEEDNMKAFTALLVKAANAVKRGSSDKKIKDPLKPKGKKSAYIIFCTKKREEAKKLLGPDAKATDVTSKLGQMWNELKNSKKTADKKVLQLCEQEAAEDKARYDEDMKDYVPPSDDELIASKGKGKGKKKSDPNAPKGKKSAYIFFCTYNRDAAKTVLSGKDSKATDVTKLLATWWNDLKTDEDRSDDLEKYNKMAADDKVRHDKETEEYALFGGDDQPVVAKKSGKKSSGKKSDPNATKGKKSAYIFFCAEKRAAAKTEIGKDGKATDVTKLLATWWNELKADDDRSDELEKYSKMAADDKIRYEQEKGGVEETPKPKKGKIEDRPQSDEEPPKKSKKTNGYTHFCSANRTSVKEDNPEMSATEITKELARQWKELDEDEQNEWKQAV